MIRPLNQMSNILLYKSYTFGFEFCLIHVLLLLSGRRARNENPLVQQSMKCLSLSVIVPCLEEIFLFCLFLVNTISV